MTSKNDWRLDLLKCVQNIFIHEQQLITNEARTLEDKINQSHSSKSSNSTELKKCREELEKLNKRVERLTKVIQEGVSQIRVADRVSLINEVKDLKKRLNSKSSSGSRKGSSSEEPKGRSQDSSIVAKLVYLFSFCRHDRKAIVKKLDALKQADSNNTSRGQAGNINPILTLTFK